MAFKKVIARKREPKISVCAAVKKWGDDWRYFTNFGIQGIDLEFSVGSHTAEAIRMRSLEKGLIGRVCDVDVNTGARLMEEDARQAQEEDIDEDEPDQYGRTPEDDRLDDPRHGLAESIRSGLA